MPHEKIPDQTYTGKAIRPPVKVYYAGMPLTEKKDYTITFDKNVNVSSAASFTIKGKGNFSGKEDGTFTIVPRDIFDDDSTISDIAPVVYNTKKPKACKPVPKLTYNRMNLKKDRDFTVKYYKDEACTEQIDAPVDIGRYYVKIDGIGNYTGTVYKEFDILDPKLKHVSKLTISKIADQPYTGRPVDVQDLDLIVKDGRNMLKMGVDYEAVTYGGDIGASEVIITGKEDRGYTGRRIVKYNITGIPMNKVKVTELPGTLVYNGSAQDPDFRLTYKANAKSDEKVISYKIKEEYDRLSPDEQKSINCLVSYGENLNVGTGTVTLTGIHECYGTVKKTFKITQYDITPAKDTEDQLTVSLSKDSYPFAKSGSKPKPEVKFKGVLLKEGTDYTLAYSNNTKPNDLTGRLKPTVKVKGKGNFKGTDETTFFKIKAADMKEAGVSVTAEDVLYKDVLRNWKTTITVTDKDGKKLTAGTDYDKNMLFTLDVAGKHVIPSDTKLNPGTPVYVTVYAKEGAAYSGSVTGSYRIVKNDISKLSASIEPKKYTGKAVKLSKDDITWKKSGKAFDLPDEAFEIVETTYKNNINKGRATVVVRGIGNDWGGTKPLTFTIGPKDFWWWWRNLQNL